MDGTIASLHMHIGGVRVCDFKEHEVGLLLTKKIWKFHCCNGRSVEELECVNILAEHQNRMVKHSTIKP